MGQNLRKKIRNLLLTEVEKKSKLKILYLHGLGSNPDNDHTIMLEPMAKFIVPKLDYRKRKLFNDLSALIDKEKPNAIIGHSLGGFLAYHLSVEFNLPCLLFNPAFHDPDSDKQSLPTDIENQKNSSSNNYAIVGTKDNIVPTKNQIKFLKKTNFKIKKLDIDHDIPDDVKYNEVKEFIDKLY